MIPTPTPLPSFDMNYTYIVSEPWSNYYLQTLNETMSGFAQDIQDLQVTIVIILMFVLGLMMLEQFRRFRR